jgi:hypothetical protein
MATEAKSAPFPDNPQRTDEKFSAKPTAPVIARNSAGQFLKGSGGLGGRKPGSRNRLASDLTIAFSNDFAAHGVEAIERVRVEQPDRYLRLCVDLLPKDFAVAVDISLKAAISAGEAFRLLSELPEPELLELQANGAKTD